MKLETEAGTSIEDATEKDLLRAFRDDATRGEFIILGPNEQVYIQASGTDDGPYVMEYRVGDDGSHFQCTQELSKKQVKSAFIKYLNQDLSWKTDFQWKQPEKKPWWKWW